MTTNTFKPGDKVVVNQDATANANIGNPDLLRARIEGTVLTVKKAEEPFIRVEEFEGQFYAKRFQLAPKAKPKRDYVADHARRSLRTAGLTPEQAAKFVENAKKLKPYGAVPDHVIGTNKVTGHIDLSGLSRMTQPGRVADVLGYAFSWGASPEGTAYWAKAHTHLSRLAANPQPK
jgi:hypothetical protein